MGILRDILIERTVNKRDVAGEVTKLLKMALPKLQVVDLPTVEVEKDGNDQVVTLFGWTDHADADKDADVLSIVTGKKVKVEYDDAGDTGPTAILTWID